MGNSAACTEVTGAAKSAELDFNGVRAGEVARGRAVFSNTGEKPIAIKSINASCSCVKVLGFSKTVAANATGTVLLEFRPLKPGHFEIEVLIETDREKDAVIALNWAADVAAADKNQPPSDIALRNGILISPQEAAGMRGDPSVMLVDGRDPADFNLCHAEGSVNWQTRVLKEINSLKSRKLVLIGKGHNDEAVVRDALALQAAGFASTCVLQGGLRAWMQMRLPLIGPGAGTVRPANIAPLELFAARQDEWLIIELDSSEPVPGNGIPGATRLALKPDWVSEFSRILKSESADRGTPFRVLMVSEAGEKYESIAKELPGNLPATVFFLDGGLRAYRHFALEHAALQNRREIRLLPAQSIAQGSNSTVLHDTTGCASCPPKKGVK